METNLHFKQEFLGCPPPHPCEQCKKMQYWLLIHRGVPNLSPLKSRHDPKVLAQNKTRQVDKVGGYVIFSGGGGDRGSPRYVFWWGVYGVKAAPEEHFEFCERPAVDTLTLLKFRKWPFPQLSSLHPPVFALYWGRRASSDRPQCKQIKPPLSVFNKCIKDTK